MLLKIFILPLKGVIKLGQKVKEEVDKELYDVDFIQRQLAQIQIAFERHEISETEFSEKEGELLERYQKAKELELAEHNELD